jgi:S1-C subfamily serine protease
VFVNRFAPGSVLPLLLLAVVPAAAAAQAVDGGPAAVYRAVADGIVAVRAAAPLGERSGSGFVLGADGLILTSYACCPEGAANIRVWTRGPRLHEAELVACSKRDEVSLLRIRPSSPLKPLAFGRSSELRVGQRSYTIGNAANSIILDDQPALNAGIVSAIYRLGETRANSTYTGPAFETSAAVNVGMEGAPVLDAAGLVVGLVTLNYSPHRFLGVAVPVDEFRPVVERLRAGAAPGPAVAPAAGPGSVGLSVRDENGRVVVDAVDAGGPADRAGLGKGDVLLQAGGRPLRTAKEFRDLVAGLEVGALLWLRAEVGGRAEDVKLPLEARK